MNFVVYPDVFTAQECEELVVLGQGVLVSDGPEAGGIEGLEDSGRLRDSSVGWIARDGATEWAYRRLEGLAAHANRTWGLAIDGIEEDLQYTVYDRRGAHYTWHHDGLELGVEDRKLSLVVQLSESGGYRGADLEFLEVASDYDSAERADYLRSSRELGCVVVFCSFEYHRVTPLQIGTRRSLVAWVAGPRLR